MTIYSMRFFGSAASHGSGLTALHSDQCPYIDSGVKYISATAKKHDIPLRLLKLDDCLQAQSAPAPYGVFSLLYNGKFITHRPGLPRKLLRQILEARGILGNAS